MIPTHMQTLKSTISTIMRVLLSESSPSVFALFAESLLGANVGSSVVGAGEVGSVVGTFVGAKVGFPLGSLVGLIVGLRLGCIVGFLVGLKLGLTVGSTVGEIVINSQQYSLQWFKITSKKNQASFCDNQGENTP